jgi:hypothetical protein
MWSFRRIKLRSRYARTVVVSIWVLLPHPETSAGLEHEQLLDGRWRGYHEIALRLAQRAELTAQINRMETIMECETE